ncbi:MAG: BMP family protein [SAR324 cluster bacterium]|jgi:basic membrane lipoprotein Med (substrate-binding protein (PBP1-ABC) superfamily)|nr:BMP family protein [SAR324 cluster bacterium]MDP7502116.1 BMP family protein [SAR324 cluster bacterium]|tara:strand:- start:1513 stop:2550 length:1038 start_codon:yes stop_codon:yes gene_type:complete
MQKIIKTIIFPILIGMVLVFPNTKEALAVPTSVKIAYFFTGPLDEPWAQAMYQAVQRVKKNTPKGLEIKDRWFEKVPIDDYEKFIRDVVQTGLFDIIWLHDASAGTDPVDNLRKEFPDQIFPVTASNYRPVGGNAYWIQAYAHEAAFLCGVIAGMVTQKDTIGMVAGFPYASVNHLLNAFADGARSVNSKVKFKVAYIEAWWDPVKAKETALAQIEAGADVIYSERYGAFEAARDKKVYAFGNQADMHDLAPETIISSPLMYWDPSIKQMIELWYNNKVNGTAYNAPADKPVFFLMKDGGSAVAPLYQFEKTLPKATLDKFNETKTKIINGSLQVELKLKSLKSD